MQLLAFYYSTQPSLFQPQGPGGQGRNRPPKFTSPWQQFRGMLAFELIAPGGNFAVTHTELI